jgi:hypothetical protein
MFFTHNIKPQKKQGKIKVRYMLFPLSKQKKEVEICCKNVEEDPEDRLKTKRMFL